MVAAPRERGLINSQLTVQPQSSSDRSNRQRFLLGVGNNRLVTVLLFTLAKLQLGRQFLNVTATNMLIDFDPFPGYTGQQDFILRILLRAERAAAAEVRLSCGDRVTKLGHMIQGEWKLDKAPPPWRLWDWMIEGIFSLLRYPNSLPEGSAGEIQSEVLDASWVFCSEDVNRQVYFVRGDPRPEVAAWGANAD